MRQSPECVLLSLVNEEANLANSQAEQSQAGNPRKDTGEKEGGVWEMPADAEGVRFQNITRSHRARVNIQINRNGLI